MLSHKHKSNNICRSPSAQPKQTETKIGRNRNKSLTKAEALAEIQHFDRKTVLASQFTHVQSLFWTRTD